MESNEQTELTSKIETNSLVESRMTAKVWGELEGRVVEQKGIRTHGHGQQCGDCWGEGV